MPDRPYLKCTYEEWIQPIEGDTMQYPIAVETDQFHDKNVEAVMKKMHKRSLKGLAKYGTDTARSKFTHKRWLLETQEELMDAVIYLEACLGKMDD